MRQSATAEADRFRVTLETSQMVRNQFKLSEAPEVFHGRPVLVVPGCHARLSNIGEDGNFIHDEVFSVKGKQTVRKAGTPAGQIMRSWRDLKYSDDAEVRGWLEDIEVMQQPSAFADGVIVPWIQEMRLNEGYDTMITVRDLFAGALSASALRMAFLSSSLCVWIAGKMTAVMQLTDTSVAFGLKKHVEQVKEEVRRAKRGGADWDAAFLGNGKQEMRCTSRDLLRICGESWKRLKHADEVVDPSRLLRAARAAGWMSYRGDPTTKTLVRCDHEGWLMGRSHGLPEESHRRPACWWEKR